MKARNTDLPMVIHGIKPKYFTTWGLINIFFYEFIVKCVNKNYSSIHTQAAIVFFKNAKYTPDTAITLRVSSCFPSILPVKNLNKKWVVKIELKNYKNFKLVIYQAHKRLLHHHRGQVVHWYPCPTKSIRHLRWRQTTQLFRWIRQHIFDVLGRPKPK